MENAVFIVTKTHQNGSSSILFPSKTFDGAVTKLRQNLAGQGWVDRFEGAYWNKGEECIKITMYQYEG